MGRDQEQELGTGDVGIVSSGMYVPRIFSRAFADATLSVGRHMDNAVLLIGYTFLADESFKCTAHIAVCRDPRGRGHCLYRCIYRFGLTS
jgi:hypothetical protein